MMSENPGRTTPTLGWANVGLGLSFILFDVFVSAIFGLGIGRSLLISALRCVLQLGVVAILLQQVFATENPWAVGGIARECDYMRIELLGFWFWLISLFTVLLNLLGTFEIGECFVIGSFTSS
jgi:hypothetical protein